METITLSNGRTFRVVSSTPVKTPPPAAKRVRKKITPPLCGEAVESGTLTLSMAPPSVNTLFTNARKGRRKTWAYRNWCAFADRELRDQPSWHVPGRVKILVRVGGSRADSDNMLKAALDALVRCGRIVNDDKKHVADSRAIHDPSIAGTLIEIARAA